MILVVGHPQLEEFRKKKAAKTTSSVQPDDDGAADLSAAAQQMAAQGNVAVKALSDMFKQTVASSEVRFETKSRAKPSAPYSPAPPAVSDCSSRPASGTSGREEMRAIPTGSSGRRTRPRPLAGSRRPSRAPRPWRAGRSSCRPS